ncbi:hypothetical protein CRENPOLYSF2_3150007 [Crenothrix polyspora]|uniref:Uncharacterized protein n=1 Tax=Crenothrix polyspora TaxID=360316 RepID=A0A1R4HAB3_9GAMM|nr:hypothetical protein CRENPOLYSF2_3150007 [Crenothrix polyspora]
MLFVPTRNNSEIKGGQKSVSTLHAGRLSGGMVFNVFTMDHCH